MPQSANFQINKFMEMPITESLPDINVQFLKATIWLIHVKIYKYIEFNTAYKTGLFFSFLIFFAFNKFAYIYLKS